jgi:hypothetical protein
VSTKPGITILPARVDDRGASRLEIRPDREDLLALDQHVGLSKIAHRRIHGHHGPAADQQPPPRPPTVFGPDLVIVVLCGSRRRVQAQPGRRCGRCRGFQEIAPGTVVGARVVLRPAVIAHPAHELPSSWVNTCGMRNRGRFCADAMWM